MSSKFDQNPELQAPQNQRFTSSDRVYRGLLTACAALILVIVLAMFVVIGQGDPCGRPTARERAAQTRW